jgi:hypothetical protein
MSVDYIESQEHIYLDASGNIFDNNDDTTIDLKAGDNKWIECVAGNIGSQDGSNDIYLDLAEHSEVFVSAQSNIHLRGEGALTLKAQTVNGAIDIIANDEIDAQNIVAGGDNKAVSIHNTSGDMLVGRITSDQDIALRSDQGAILGSDLIHLAASQNITLTAAKQIGDINSLIELADNSNVTAHTTTAGSIYLKGMGTLTLNDINATGGDIQIIAANDLIAEKIVNSNMGNALKDISLQSTTGSIVAGAISSSNNLSMHAGQAIVDSRDWIKANEVIMNAVTGIGADMKYMTFDVNRLDAVNQSIEGIYISNIQTLTLTDLNADDHAVQNKGDILIVSLGGDVITSQTIQGHSDILLQSQSASLSLESDILTDEGNMSLLADHNINQSQNIIASKGTVDMYAAQGEITMADSSKTQTLDGNIRYQAGGDIIIDNIDAGSKNVGIYSNSGNIYASSQSTINIISENLRMESEGNIGTITKHLNTLTD